VTHHDIKINKKIFCHPCP